MTVESSYQLGGSVEAEKAQESQFPLTVTRVFEEANNTEGEKNMLSLFLTWLIQTWLANILLSPLLLYNRIISGLLLFFSLSRLDDCLRKSLESYIYFFLGLGQKEKSPLAAAAR